MFISQFNQLHGSDNHNLNPNLNYNRNYNDNRNHNPNYNQSLIIINPLIPQSLSTTGRKQPTTHELVNKTEYRYKLNANTKQPPCIAQQPSCENLTQRKVSYRWSQNNTKITNSTMHIARSDRHRRSITNIEMISEILDKDSKY